MEKMVLKNKMELEIMEGAALSAITTVVGDWTALGAVAETLRETGNLDEVQFKTDETVTGEYRNMKLVSPLFSAVDIAEDGKIHATFGIRQKTEMELAIEQLQKGQGVQDGAIITTVVGDWTALGAVAETLRETGNLDEVQFKTDETVTGEYRNMKLVSPLFSAVDIAEDGKIHATFGIRQKTEMELAIEQLQKGQGVQDGAITIDDVPERWRAKVEEAMKEEGK